MLGDIMRKAILFNVSIAMVVGGLYVLAAELFWAPKIRWFTFGGAALAGVGAYLIWENFIAPTLGVQTKEIILGRTTALGTSRVARPKLTRLAF